MKIRFIKDYRAFPKGEIIEPDPSVGELYIQNGVAELLKESNPKENKTKKRAKK